MWCTAKVRRKSSHWMVFERKTSGSWHFHSLLKLELSDGRQWSVKPIKLFAMAFRCSQSSVAYASQILTATTMSGSLNARVLHVILWILQIFYCRRMRRRWCWRWTREPNRTMTTTGEEGKKKNRAFWITCANLFILFSLSRVPTASVCVCVPSKSETCPFALHLCVMCLWIFACETFSKLSNRCYFCCAQQNEYIRKIINIVESSRVEVNRDLQLLLIYPTESASNTWHTCFPPTTERTSFESNKSECIGSCGPLRLMPRRHIYGFVRQEFVTQSTRYEWKTKIDAKYDGAHIAFECGLLVQVLHKSIMKI